MTRKPRSAYTDYTRKDRAARRRALLDAAAQRMGVPSWSGVETLVRQALEDAQTDEQAAARLNSLVWNLSERIKAGDPDQPPADVQAIYEQHPVVKEKRQPEKPKKELETLLK